MIEAFAEVIKRQTRRDAVWEKMADASDASRPLGQSHGAMAQ